MRAGWNSLSTLAATSKGACAVYSAASPQAFCFGDALGPGKASLGLSNFVEVELETTWKTLSTGRYTNVSTGADDHYSCGVWPDGSTWCFGTDSTGVGLLGTRPQAGSRASRPLKVADVIDAGPWSAVSVGSGGFSCGIKTGVVAADSDSTWCWGSNGTAALGCGELPGSLSEAEAPCLIQFGSAANEQQPRMSTIAAGHTAACGTDYDGRVWCW